MSCLARLMRPGALVEAIPAERRPLFFEAAVTAIRPGLPVCVQVRYRLCPADVHGALMRRQDSPVDWRNARAGAVLRVPG